MAKHLIPSRRGRPGEDPIFTLSQLARVRKEAGEAVIDATIGVLLNDSGQFVILQAVIDTVQQIPPKIWSSYAPIAGPPAFLQAIKNDLLGSRAPELFARAAAVATPGGTGALRHAVTLFLEEGQQLLTSSFYWSPYATIAAEHGRGITTFQMFNEQGLFDIKSFEEALRGVLSRQKRALVVLNDPCHNPTGYSMSEADWQAVASCLSSNASLGPITLILDTAYAAFFESSIERAVRALAPIADTILIGFCWSASKTFLQYGQRVGALVVVPPSAHDTAELEATLTFACRGTWSNCNHGGMVAVSHLLTDPAARDAVDIERREIVTILNTRVALWNSIATPLGVRYPRYDGGFFVTVLCAQASSIAATLRDRGVFVVPLSGGLRIALCSVATHQIEPLVHEIANSVLSILLSYRKYA